jgi:hypothetical protein
MKNQGLNHIPSVRGHILNLSLNLVFVAIFYVFLGAAVSYGLSRIFPSYDETWKTSSLAYQSTDFVNTWIPIFRVSSALEHYVESFGGQMVFIYAVFIFMETLDDKLIHVFKQVFEH